MHRLIAILSALLLVTGTASAVELRFAHWLPERHPLHAQGFVPWAEAIAAASGGRITITFYPAQQLGAAADHYDMTRDGIADIGFVNPGYQPGRFPVIALGEIPFLLSNATSGSRAFDAWYRRYAAVEMPDVQLCMAFVHDPGTFHGKFPIRRPEDIRGRNIRPAHATMGRFVGLLGGSSVWVSAPEAREAIARGAADAITFPWNSLFIFGLQDLVTHHLDLPLYVTTFVVPINRTLWESLEPRDRDVLAAHCTSEWAERVASPWADNEASGRTRIRELPGHELYAPTAEEVAAWRQAAAPLLETWKQDVAARGIDPEAAHAELIEELRRAGALFE